MNGQGMGIHSGGGNTTQPGTRSHMKNAISPLIKLDMSAENFEAHKI